MFSQLTAEEEQEFGRAIRAEEEAAREAIAGVPEAEKVLRRKGTRSERTRAGQVDRLIEAVAVTSELCLAEPDLGPRVEQARRHLARAEELRWQLATSALRVVRGEARKLANAMMSQEDLVQEGHIGLLRAAKRFDPDRGIRFATYARWWVRAQMTRAMENGGRLVRLPGGAVEQIRNLQKAASRFRKLGIDFDVDSLAAEVGVDRSRAELLLSHGSTLSLDQEDPDGNTLIEQLEADGRETEPDRQAIDEQGLLNLGRVFDGALDEREHYIIVHHFGLKGAEARSMTKIGNDLGISRERVRQIEVEALDRLRGMI